MSFSAGRSYHVAVRGAVSLFAYQLGMNFIAAQGPMVLQAQSGPMSLASLTDLTISSTEGKVVITAAKEVWIGAGGSYVQINGSGITNGSPGPILEKTPKWSKQGVSMQRIPFAALPIPAAECLCSDRLDLSGTGVFDEALDHPWSNLEYLVTDKSGNAIASGTVDSAASSSRFFTRTPQDVDVWVGQKGLWDAEEEDLDNDENFTGA